MVELALKSLREPLSYWRLPESFIAQGRVVTMRPKAPHVAPGKVKPYAIDH
jgi:hypothetical protein